MEDGAGLSGRDLARQHVQSISARQGSLSEEDLARLPLDLREKMVNFKDSMQETVSRLTTV